ncbi:MAG: WYL domain-containing protein [Proteobacteria bacterium]|nr:WYL domain-containing protein [Pseudomonadota bacterium]MBU1640618.1 WYL domain-containing protein [Pseudomonadota bacterium]
MAKYKPQHSRLLFIDRKIQEGRFPNCSSLAAEWEVSSKTIQRDLEYLRYDLEAPLEYSAKERGYYYTEERFQLPAMDVKESDLFAIYLAEKLLSQYEGTPVYHNLCQVFQKIEDSLPSKTTLGPGSDFSRFSFFSAAQTMIRPGIWQAVFDGLRTLHSLDIKYQLPGSKDKGSKRRIDPYHGVRFEGDWYVIAYCHLRKAIRTFSLARISEAAVHPERFTIPDDFDFQAISASHFGVHWSDNETKVRIRFGKEVAPYIRERTWHESQQITNNEDGSLDLELTVSHLFELKKWLLSWGSQAQVLEPGELAKEIKAEVGAMARLYDGG